MPTSFLTDTNQTAAIRLSRQTTSEPSKRRESVKILIIGSPQAVTNMIHSLYSLGFAEVKAWSPLQPTGNPGEVMSMLIRQITFN